MPISAPDLQTELLRVLMRPSLDHRIGGGRHYLAEAVRAEFPDDDQPSRQQILAAMWALLGQGLAYIDIGQDAATNWTLHLTESGYAAAQDQALNPDNAGEYLRRLRALVPDASPTVLQYVQEAVEAYAHRLYLASTVMLGVASEAAFLELGRAFAAWLPPTESNKLTPLLDSQKSNYLRTFEEFRKRLEPHKPQLPDELADNLTLMLDAVLDLLRVYRNDAGHPTGKQVDRSAAAIHLEIFGRYLDRMYALKRFFAPSDS